MPILRLPCCLRRTREGRALAVGTFLLLGSASNAFTQETSWPPRKPIREIQPASAVGEQPVELSMDEELADDSIRAIWDTEADPDSGIDDVDKPPSNDALDKPLAAVRAEGNVSIPEHAITSRVHSRAGRTTSVSQIEEDVQTLISSRLFFNVTPVLRTSDEGPVLVFRVTERPILRKVEFKGNKKIKTGQLEAELGLKPGHAYDVQTNVECVNRIKSLYSEKGYRHATVELEKGRDPNDRDVIFHIVEGPKVRVGDIQFQGNQEIASRFLKTKLATKEAILYYIGGAFDPEIVANDVIGLKKYYADLGYFDAEVDFATKENPENGRVTVVFRITEGQRYKVREQLIEGNHVLTQQRLFEDQKLKSGQFFNARFLAQDVTRMKEQYDNLGRLFSVVQPTPRFLEEPGWVDVVYQVEEDEPRRIGMINIHIRGDHPHTREDVVRNQINKFLKPGNLASGKDLKMAKAILQGHHIWDRSQPAAIEVAKAEGSLYLPQQTIARGQDATSSGDSVDNVLSDLGPVDWTGRATRTSGFSPSGDDAHELSADDFLQSLPGHSSSSPKGTPPASNTKALPVSDRRTSMGQGRRTLESAVHLAGHSTAALPPVSRALRPSPRSLNALDAASDERQDLVAASYNIDPTAIFEAEEQDLVVRAQSPGDDVRGQSLDPNGNPIPQNYMGAVSPQGDPFGDAFNRPGEPAFVDINIDVSEGRTGRLMFGVGVNSDAGVIGQFTLQEDNFDILRPPRSWADILNGQAWRGRGQSFRIEAMPGSQVSRYLVSFTDPYFLRTDYNLGVSGFYYNRYFQDWTEDRGGGRISLGKLLTRYWSISAALRLESVAIHDFRTPAPQSILDVQGSNFLSTGQLSLQHDSRDSAFLPTMGHLFEVSYEQGFGEFVYPRVEGSFSQVFTVWERPDGMGKHLLSFRTQLGWTGDDTPVFENFYAGGYSSFRGFAFRGVAPRDMGFRVGGQWMSLGTVEYMAPITADDNIRAVAFTDMGTVDTDVSMRDFRLSVGFGARLIIPAMGPAPIALDFAFPLLKEREDNERIFSFYVGFTR